MRSCYHCTLPVAAGGRFVTPVLGEPREFCCPGCQAVAHAIVAGGLESYYLHRSEASVNPQVLPTPLADEQALFDRPDVQAPFVRHDTAAGDVAGDVAETTLMIEGITCAACGWLIERHLRTLPAVVEARLNLSNHRLHLRWHDPSLPLSEVLSELRSIGYAGHPYQADKATEHLARENRRSLRQLGVAGLLWFQAMMATMATWPEFNIDLSPEMHTILRWVAMFLTTPIVFYSCAPFFKGALRDLRARHLTMDVSVSLAIGAAYLAGLWTAVTGVGELYFDAVGMFALFLLTGRYLERRARERTRLATAQLVNLLPASCLRLDADGQTERVLTHQLRLHDHVLVHPGASLPADGRVIDGRSSVDESLLTGEYLPQPREVGDAVTAGTANIESVLTVEVLALGADTRLSAVVRLLERAQSEKPPLAQMADRAAQWFLLISLVLAACVGVVWWQLDAGRAFWIVLAMLVATCPCALSLATPTALTAATGTLHRLGLLLTRGHVLEGLNRIDTVIFDKTGTLTEGRLTLKAIRGLGAMTSDECLSLAAALESRSEHPIARAFGKTPLTAEGVVATPGLGLEGQVNGCLLRIGQPAFVCALSGVAVPLIPDEPGQWLLLGNDTQALAWLVLDDRLRDDAAALVEACRQRGWQTLLLSGDSSPMVSSVANQLQIDDARGSLRPDDKLAILQQLRAEGRTILVIGDGVNDVPVLAAADISIAMGSATDLAKTSADAVLLSNRLHVLVDAFALARRTRRIILENLAWAGLYNGLVLPFAALGWVTPLWAAAGMSMSSLVVVVNALRLTRMKPLLAGSTTVPLSRAVPA
ncbi:heavy metal translocating P-type ATPase [Pseudomonas petrae]|uniref:Cadmium-translocating P-type ATPase n=1 Tax=Pseudomonas petrae TaxID=2912190 RepID=A0ABS9I368_9PSED|nr:heavy metal translocating P-type ATPase [Pseudomonas petrae]MCF7533760.1 cadmium-translocating P-type ATPase [Pseudomonas petrae]MCF7538307.1 cadmium-translocating P-type ATPase [Pseudomonas petrae]MCF7542228.1 cadmium-translocating P-type ATPase [Pseudomonas petrae]MCF7555672.1 cadmium-translocating P-type ATPase [Pseudomonas petrae]